MSSICLGFLTYDDLISWCWLRLVIVALWLEPITTSIITSLEVFTVITSTTITTTTTTTTSQQIQYWNILLVAEFAALLLNIVTMVQMMSIMKMSLTSTAAAYYPYKKTWSQVAVLVLNMVSVQVWTVVLLYVWWDLVPVVNHWQLEAVLSVFQNFVLQETSQHVLEIGMSVFVCLFHTRWL